MSSQIFPSKGQRLRSCTSSRWVVLLATSMTLVACGDTTSKTATQVVAKVNKEEISVHQINYVLQRTPGVTADTADAASREILERLIRQELAVQKARDLKLDRSPDTVQALEAARREVLARAYIDTLGQGIAKPTSEEVVAFYAGKPALFKERKVYTFEEVSIAGSPSHITEVQAQLTAAKSTQEFVDYLKASGLRFGTKLVTQPAENLPLELLDQFAALAPGHALFLPQSGGAKVLILASARPEPIDQAAAAPAIETFLLNDRKRVKTEAEIKALRDGAQVQLIGKFAEPAASSVPAAAPILAIDPTSSRASAAAAPAEPAASGLSADVVRKGMSGLK